MTKIYYDQDADLARLKGKHIGIIGYGKMGRIRHETLAQGQQGRVVAIAEPAGSPQTGGVRRYEQPESLLADPEVDAVFICTPNVFNKPLTIQALEAGKHVFCEKPPACTGRDVEEIIAVERAFDSERKQ
jgi:predicted dehydrogenase